MIHMRRIGKGFKKGATSHPEGCSDTGPMRTARTLEQRIADSICKDDNPRPYHITWEGIFYRSHKPELLVEKVVMATQKKRTKR